MSLILTFLGALDFLCHLRRQLYDSHGMGIPDGNWNKVFAAIDIDQNGEANLLAVLEEAPRKTTYISSHLIATPGCCMGVDVRNCDMHILLLLIEFLLVSKSFLHAVVLDHGRSRVFGL